MQSYRTSFSFVKHWSNTKLYSVKCGHCSPNTPPTAPPPPPPAMAVRWAVLGHRWVIYSFPPTHRPEEPISVKVEPTSRTVRFLSSTPQLLRNHAQRFGLNYPGVGAGQASPKHLQVILLRKWHWEPLGEFFSKVLSLCPPFYSETLKWLLNIKKAIWEYKTSFHMCKQN